MPPGCHGSLSHTMPYLSYQRSDLLKSESLVIIFCRRGVFWQGSLRPFWTVAAKFNFKIKLFFAHLLKEFMLLLDFQWLSFKMKNEVRSSIAFLTEKKPEDSSLSVVCDSRRILKNKFSKDKILKQITNREIFWRSFCRQVTHLFFLPFIVNIVSLCWFGIRRNQQVEKTEL